MEIHTGHLTATLLLIQLTTGMRYGHWVCIIHGSGALMHLMDPCSSVMWVKTTGRRLTCNYRVQAATITGGAVMKESIRSIRQAVSRSLSIMRLLIIIRILLQREIVL